MTALASKRNSAPRGEVDEVFIFGGALSHAEIRGLKERNEMPR